MVTALLLDKTQIESVSKQLADCKELGAESAVLFLVSGEKEGEALNRSYEEYQQGDPPMSLVKPDVAYAGPVWVVGLNGPVELIIESLEDLDN